MDSRRGFTLLEIIIFMGIFSVIIVGFLTVFVSVSQIQVKQSASAEVAAQSQFLLQTFQYYIERASEIDGVADTPASTVTLRMPNSAEDPVVFGLSSGFATISVAGGQAKTLTSNKVSVTSLQFTKRANSPGHDSLSVAFNVEYNTANIKQRAVQALATAVVRVSAATFDSNINSSAPATNYLGTSVGEWRGINNTMYFTQSGNVGVGVTTPTAKFEVGSGNIALDGAGNGVILKSPGGGCFLLTISNTGGISTSSTSCAN